MHIEITGKEYRELLDMLHIADVVMSGHRRDEDRRTLPHRALIQKLYALAQGEGLEGLIIHDASVSKYVPTADFEQNSVAHRVIDEFANHLFWDQLITRLTERDAAQVAGGADRFHAMNDGDRQHVEGHIRQRYNEEFAMNGIANLTVIERFSAGKGTPVKTSD